MTAIESKAMRLIATRLGIGTERIGLQSRLIADLGADSLDMVDVMMDLEKEFYISISDAEVEKIVTVHDIVHMLNAKLKGMASC